MKLSSNHLLQLQAALLIGIAALLPSTFSLPANAQVATAPIATIQAVDTPAWKLAWHDEFDGPKIDTDTWELFDLRDSHNNEKQYYVPEQMSIVDGKLHITATDEPKDGKLYRSGRLWTRQLWTAGRFEARIKLPKTKGMWPAFWLLPRNAQWPSGGEIDIMESWGSNPFKISSAFHWGKTWEVHQYKNHRYTANDENGERVNFQTGFHVYAVEWEPEALRFFVDDHLHFTLKADEAPFGNTPKSIVINLAVGGHYDGDPDDSTVFPQVMEVDYVRVWEHTDESGVAPSTTTSPGRTSKKVLNQITPPLNVVDAISEQRES